MAVRIQLRRDTAANWVANNPMFALTIEPKTTTNSQSQTVWVGKYIFN